MVSSFFNLWVLNTECKIKAPYGFDFIDLFLWFLLILPPTRIRSSKFDWRAQVEKVKSENARSLALLNNLWTNSKYLFWTVFFKTTHLFLKDTFITMLKDKNNFSNYKQNEFSFLLSFMSNSWGMSLNTISNKIIAFQPTKIQYVYNKFIPCW